MASALDTAIACSDPVPAEALHRLGLEHFAKQRMAAAADALDRAAAADPANALYAFNLGVVLAAAGRGPEALAAYDQAIAHNPAAWRAHLNAGVMRRETGDLVRAEAHFTAVTAVDPGNAAAIAHLASVVAGPWRRDEVHGLLQRAVTADPAYYQAWNNLGNLVRDAGRPEAALAHYDKAIELAPDDPEPHINRATALLVAGRFDEGWPEYRWRLRRPGADRAFARPQWDGAPLDGRRILVHAEQGLGDTIQFARFLPMVAARGGRILFECQAALKPLLESQVAADRVIARGERLPDFAEHFPLVDLPGLFGTGLDSIPAARAYLEAPAAVLPRDAGGRRIGLVWAGNPRHWNDANRSCRLADLAPLLEVDGAAFLSLQKGVGAAELAAYRGRVTDLGSGLRDLAEAAAQVAALDLVITVDTVIAHLAGALGKPVWVMLPHAPDWRWLLDREDSPWYPTARLFRQPEPGDWASVVARIGTELAAGTESR